jgi:redox-sensitive bicupin YhaK (pirin superfamily)
VQLWVALPKEFINTAPEFEHQADLPKITGENFAGTVLAGEFLGSQAKTKIFTEMVGVELRIPAWEDVVLSVRPDFEYGILAVEGEVRVMGNAVPQSGLEYLEPGSSEIRISTSNDPVTLILLGGVPFPEKILMWWNFIGRSHQDVALAREQWNNRETRFGQFEDQIGGWIPAPELPNLILQPR